VCAIAQQGLPAMSPGNFAYQTPRAVNANSGTTLRRNADAGLPLVGPQDRRGVGDGLAGVNVAA